MNTSAVPAARLRALRPGDTVAVIAPAGPAKAEQLPAVQAVFARFGLEARLYPSCRARHETHDFLAGDDDLRLADLHAALADPAVQAIFCLRGGYGCTRLLERIDASLVRAQRHKPLVGYSDVTALHALWQREGVSSVHAPMPASDWVREGAQPDTQALFDLLMQPQLRAQSQSQSQSQSSPQTQTQTQTQTPPSLQRPGGTTATAALLPGAWHHAGHDGATVARGRLVGGNLSLVAALCGTPWQIDTRGAILFLEDVSEALYRVDRLLVQLRQAGVLHAAAAFLLGSFTEDDDPTPVLREHLGTLGKPVLAGWPAGHGQPNRPLVLGARVALDVRAAALRYDPPPFGEHAA